MSALIILVLAASLAVSFFLSGMEAGVFALSRFRIRRLMREGNARARLLYHYLEDTQDFLWTIFMGNTLANFTATALIVVGLHRGLGSAQEWFWLLFLPGGLLFYAGFDLLPKMLFRLYPNRLCIVFLRPFRVVHHLLRPAIWLMSRISALILRGSSREGSRGGVFGSRDELREVMEDSARQMTSEEQGMISRVLDLQTLTVERVMMPLAQMVAVSAQAPVSEVLRLCREHGVTRLPVWREDQGGRRVAGLVNVRALIYQADADPARPVADYLQPALYLDQDRRLEEAMRQMRRGGQRLAIVLNGQRKEVGVVSLQDILEVVFGEFHL